MKKTLAARLEILSDAAKYDASCASSGVSSKKKPGELGLGSKASNGICHAYTPDGRCISLLKILMTNFCIYDCAYCINRSSSKIERTRFSVEEIIWITLEFYRRNYIEGLFLSSGVIRSSDYTMEEMVRVARELRLKHHFHGYIHLKTIPDAAPHLIEEAGSMLTGSRSMSRCRPKPGLLRMRLKRMPGISVRAWARCGSRSRNRATGRSAGANRGASRREGRARK